MAAEETLARDPLCDDASAASPAAIYETDPRAIRP
jgi:hypothetical protein